MVHHTEDASGAGGSVRIKGGNAGSNGAAEALEVGIVGQEVLHCGQLRIGGQAAARWEALQQLLHHQLRKCPGAHAIIYVRCLSVCIISTLYCAPRPWTRKRTA